MMAELSSKTYNEGEGKEGDFIFEATLDDAQDGFLSTG